MEGAPALIFDIGSSSIKAGIAGEEEPRWYLKNVYGQVHKELPLVCKNLEPINYVGQRALQSKAILHLSWPVERGVVKDWDTLEKVLDHLENQEGQLSFKASPVVLLEPPLNPIANGERYAEILFEKYNIPAISILNTGFATLWGSGLHTGTVIDSGADLTTITPIFSDTCLPRGIKRWEFGGNDITEYLSVLMAGRGHKFETASLRATLNDLKEKHCFLYPHNTWQTYDCTENVEYLNNREYVLPDGSTLDPIIELEMAKCAECIFAPWLIGQDQKCNPGIAKLLLSAIRKCPIDTRTPLLANVVLNGGNTLIPGFVERFENEVIGLKGWKTYQDTINALAAGPAEHLSYVGKCPSPVLSQICSYLPKKWKANSTINRLYRSWIGASAVYDAGKSPLVGFATRGQYEESNTIICQKFYSF